VWVLISKTLAFGIGVICLYEENGYTNRVFLLYQLMNHQSLITAFVFWPLFSSGLCLEKFLVSKKVKIILSKRVILNFKQWIFALVECPRSNDRMERFACPSPDFRGRFRCIDDRSLCDGFFDCPGREDESPEQCLFYKTVSIYSNNIRSIH